MKFTGITSKSEFSIGVFLFVCGKGGIILLNIALKSVRLYCDLALITYFELN